MTLSSPRSPWLLAALGALVLILTARMAHADVELKIATLAPRGSAWANIMEKANERLRAETGGRVRIRTYFGGQQGDERDVVRKMRLGQLDGGALTAVGLGLIVPQVLVLQLPFMFSSEAEIDHVRRVLGPELARQFDAAGYVLVAWGDVGWVRMYMTRRLETREDLASAKVWQWTDDPIVREYFGILGVNGVPLGVPEVLSGLQTGTIEACYGPPLAAVALQWYTKVKYMTDRPSGYGIGAFVLRKEAFAQLTPADQELLLTRGREVGAQLVASVRRDNERALRAMTKAGVEVIHVPDVAHAMLVAAGRMVWGRLAGKLYPQELLDRVRKTIAETPK